jgi:hypothetical protein
MYRSFGFNLRSLVMKSKNNGSFVFSRRFNDVFFGIIILTQVKEKEKPQQNLCIDQSVD